MSNSSESDYLMISGIRHFVFCKRRWALVHVEHQWADNVLTVEGDRVHEKVDQPFITETRNGVRIVRAMPVKSHTLQLTGVCDVVEFVEDEQGVSVSGSKEKYLPIPVEYKRGKPKVSDEDRLQLTAQAMCLEDMLLCQVPVGYLYYNETRRREQVNISDELRATLNDVVKEMQHFFQRRHTPKVKTGRYCNRCSLKDTCLPELMKHKSVKEYINGALDNEETS